ncbi:MAG: DUF4174 domain-containing protein [Xanthomonadales bacterium]
MSYLTLLLNLLMTVGESARAADTPLNDLDALRWSHRVILVFAPGPQASRAAANLGDFAAGIEERDIVWFVLDGDSLRSNYRGTLGDTLPEQLLERYFSPRPAGTSVVLIGKDGGVKSRSADLDLEATFGLIDRMPMRRREMQRRQDEMD